MAGVFPSLPPTLRPGNIGRSIEAGVPAKAVRDLTNRLRFGREAPRSDECVMIDPCAITEGYRPAPGAGAPRFGRQASGLVRGGDWDLSVSAFGANPKHQACIAHLRDGVPWEETGLFDHLMARIAREGHADGCRSLDDLRARYARLDAMAEDIRQSGRMRRRSELQGGAFRREHGGVLVHIARDGRPLRAGGGIHRFAIAQALGLRQMPAQLGVVHRDAVTSGALRALRP